LTLDGGTFDATGGAVYLGGGGQIEGSGTLKGAVIVTGGTVAPGNSPGTLHIDGNLSFDAAATLAIDLAGTSAGQFDRIETTGTATLDGTLTVQLLNAFAPSAGDSFDVLDWTTSVGAFDALVLPELADGLQWATDDLYVSGLLKVVASTSIPGDTNQDGHVDQTDAAVLAAHWGTSVTGGTADGDFNDDHLVNAADAAILAANWSPAPAEQTAVPEPAALVALLGLCMAALLRRRQNASH
jgi:hypothetical protein